MFNDMGPHGGNCRFVAAGAVLVRGITNTNDAIHATCLHRRAVSCIGHLSHLRFGQATVCCNAHLRGGLPKQSQFSAYFTACHCDANRHDIGTADNRLSSKDVCTGQCIMNMRDLSCIGTAASDKLAAALPAIRHVSVTNIVLARPRPLVEQ